MSLNWREIDLILSELQLSGAQIQRVVQPSYDTLVLSCYKSGVSSDLLFCVAHGACRLHTTKAVVPKAEKPQRFMELLRSHVKGARILSIRQIGSERIVELRLGRGESDGSAKDSPHGTPSGELLLYARLWSGAANILLCKADGEIIDALARKPQKGEISGGHYLALPGDAPPREFIVRELAGTGSFNERIDAFYTEHGSELSRAALLERAKKYFAQRRNQLDTRLSSLSKMASEYAQAERYKELGDILLANQGTTLSGSSLSASDFYRGGEVVIRVDPAKSLVENAQGYYERHRKARSGALETKAEIDEVIAHIEALEEERIAIEATDNPYLIRAFLAKRRRSPSKEQKRYSCLSMELHGWHILIGRSASENDELLRRNVRGNDLWLHARGYSGSYVFIKTKPAKSVPLDILLAAGTLALYYSKGRSAGSGDVYYTHVKYLRRVRHGPKGLVLPTQEKNLHVTIDEARIRELRRLIGRD